MMDELKENIPLQQKKTVKRLGLWFLFPLFVLVIALIVLAAQWKHSLRVQRILVEGAQLIPANDLASRASVEPKSPMFDVNLHDILNIVLHDPLVKNVRINRVLPDAIRISIDERIPIAALSDQQLQCIDDEGVLLPQMVSTAQLDLPLISGIRIPATAEFGRIIKQNDVFEVIDLLETAQSIGLTHAISEINMNNGGDIVMYTVDGGIPITVGRKEFGKKLTMLQEFWTNFIKSGDVERLRSIDLRYDGQVVVKWNQSTSSQSEKTPLS